MRIPHNHLCYLILFWLVFTGQSCESNMVKIPPDPNPTPPKTQTGESIRVLWTVAGYKISSDGQWGKNEAQALLFKPLDATSSSITFNGQTCREITFNRKTVDATPYFSQRWSITPKILGVSVNTVKIIKTDCHLPGFSEYVQLPDRRLIVRIKGVFFFLEPFVNY